MHLMNALRFLFSSFLLAVATACLPAQKMPRENVVEVPAVGTGLCVSNVFQSDMVLQRDKPIRVWGWAAPGETVQVTFGGDTQSATVGDDRAWHVTLAAQAANPEPQTMQIKGRAAALSLDNILVGDVWVLGGQSNMEFELAKVEHGPLEIASANYPKIRILTVPYGIGPEPKQGFARLHEWSGWFGRHFRKGDWDECTPKVARELSAIGYAFARRVHMASKIPIGVIDASRGGTTVETWTPIARLRAMQSTLVRDKLADWEGRVAAWDADKDLEDRIRKNRAWVERQEKANKQVPDDRRKDPTDLRPGPVGDHNHPGHCFAGMIEPLRGLAVKGAIFHQGYNNAFDGMPGVAFYREVLPEMIRSWRALFGDPELPFGIISQCTDGYPQTRDDYCEKMLNTGIYIRAAHYETFVEFLRAGDENIGFASSYDLRRRWYHPQVKVPAGERIARWALATEYGFGRELRWKPPMLVSMQAREGSLLLQLDADVMDPEDGAIQGFAIAGDDRCFHPADAAYLEIGKDGRGRPRFDRKQLVLTSPLVASPKHFRYAWGRNPLANLQATNNKDLPFATQRSDDWPMWAVPLGVIEEEVVGKMDRRQTNRVRQALRREDMRRRLFEAEQFVAENKARFEAEAAAEAAKRGGNR